MWHNMDWGMWLLMGLGTAALWGLVLLVLRAQLPVQAARPLDPGDSDLLLLLKARFARGEITAEQYEHDRRLLVDGHVTQR